MAPNYQAGKDFIAGFKRNYKGEVIDEIYTPLNQPDFSAELAQVAAKNPDAVYVFYPGGLGVNFVRQYKQAGLPARCRCCRRRPPTARRCPRRRTTRSASSPARSGDRTSTIPVNRKFVDDFEKKYNRIPSQYAAQSYDAALLLDSAIGKVKGNVADKKAFLAALKAADFKSVRGNFKFNNNGFPIQDHVRLRGRQGREGPREPEDHRHAAQGPQGRLPHAVHVEVMSEGAFARGSAHAQRGAIVPKRLGRRRPSASSSRRR